MVVRFEQPPQEVEKESELGLSRSSLGEAAGSLSSVQVLSDLPRFRLVRPASSQHQPACRSLSNLDSTRWALKP